MEELNMDQENKYYLILAVIAGLTIIVVVGLCSHHYTERTKAAFAAGYEESTLPGSSNISWVKIK